MAPWLLDLLGLPNQGRGFELVWWSLVALVGVWLLNRERRAQRALADGWLGWLLGAGLFALGAARVVGVAAGASFLGPDGLLIPSYGVFTAGGLGFCVWLTARDAQRRFDTEQGTLHAAGVVDLAFWVLVGGLFGARLLFMATEVSTYAEACQAGDCLQALRFWDGGLVFYGSVPGGLLAGAWWCRRNDVAFLEAADLVMTYLPLGHAIGRVGCFAAGCCFGAGCDAPWAVTYPSGSPAHIAHLEHAAAAGGVHDWDGEQSRPVHPTVLYEAALSLALFVWLRFGRVRRSVGSGRILGAWFVAYAAIRFAVEPLRGDAVRGFVAELPIDVWNRLWSLPEGTPTILSTSQLVALIAGLSGVVWLVLRRAERADQPASDVAD